MEKLLSDWHGIRETKICETHGAYVAEGFTDGTKDYVFGKCPKCEATQDEEFLKAKQATEKAREEARLQEMLDRSCLPKRFIGKTFDSFIADTKDKKIALDAAKKFAERFYQNAQSGRGLTFLGAPGTGKSHLAAAIIQTIMPDYLGVYITVSDSVRLVRDTWRKGSDLSESQVINRLVYCDLLVFDEVGKQYGTPGEKNIIFDVMDGRYREKMPTIVMGNVSPIELAQYLDERIADRLNETNGIPIFFEWDSYRERAA